MEHAGDLESRQIWENEPVSEEHRHSKYFWKLNKTNSAVPFLFFLINSFVLINSNIVYGFGDLHENILAPSNVPAVLKSSYRSNHKTLEG